MSAQLELAGLEEYFDLTRAAHLRPTHFYWVNLCWQSFRVEVVAELGCGAHRWGASLQFADRCLIPDYLVSGRDETVLVAQVGFQENVVVDCLGSCRAEGSMAVASDAALADLVAACAAGEAAGSTAEEGDNQAGADPAGVDNTDRVAEVDHMRRTIEEASEVGDP